MKFKGMIASLVGIFSLVLLSGCETNMVVFEPQGPAARSIMDLINWSLIWMLLVVVVVFVMFGFIVWKYREKPENKDYEPPEEHGSIVLEIIWTAIPILILIALTIPTVKTLYALEEVPKGYEKKEPITINVTAADWKWIFSYPEQNVETINYVNIPEDRPVHFKLTSAGTMQSFWVPALGGQKYAMNKMETELILVADNPGSYLGRNSNFNGKGYTEMEFEVLAQTQEDFDQWVKDVKKTSPKLTEKEYEKLLKPTHLGRMTFSNTHLDWVNHAELNSKNYTSPESYRGHGYQGEIFDEPAQIEDNNSNHDGHSMNDEDSNGGGHSGH
ncbi:cytochrome aa3 quinol oxidase subunit II [Bacillus sp. CGMCC 1.16607]|uniref:cytochrome aa3 quinol oxidase subunit II n=1 Tax=Bacillus sp. CGMCC 1.16607 TaxID=3351842 RepID=UPI00362CA3D5